LLARALRIALSDCALTSDLRVERRRDGAIVVRVASCDADGRPLPDAVFSFREGDSQYAKWERELLEHKVVPR